MPRLPDVEAWAIFATIVETGSFSRAATELGLSKATVSKAVGRLETRLGARLLHRSSSRLLLTEIGRASATLAARILADAEAVEDEVLSQAAAPQGQVRITAPMSFGLAYIAPLLPNLMSSLPAITIDLHLSDAQVDLIGEGFDLAVRIAALEDSALRVRRICAIRRMLVGSPAYFSKAGHPQHPRDLENHGCLSYSYLLTPNHWQFHNGSGDAISVTPKGTLRVNNADALTPALRGGSGLAVQPEFIVWQDIAAGVLEETMPGWRMSDLSLNLVMPPGGLRPKRVTAVMEYLATQLAQMPWASV